MGKKKKMKEERIYDNRWSSVLLFRARANVLDLNDRKRWVGGDTGCELCGHGYEDLEHFLMDCRILEEFRDKKIMEEMRKSRENAVGRLLFDFGGEDVETVKRMLQGLWSQRRKRRGGEEGGGLGSGLGILGLPPDSKKGGAEGSVRNRSSSE